MLGLPADVILCIADLSSLHDLCTLALLNRGINQVLTPRIYTDIKLLNRKCIENFCDAITNGRPELSSYPRLISITPKQILIKVYCALAQLIRQALLLTTNLVDLTIAMPAKAVKVIFRDTHYDFSLQTLRCPLIAHANFSRFLLEQSTIQELYVLHDVRGGINVGTILRNIDCNLLPKLRAISANCDSLRAILPARPVTSISTGSSILEVPQIQPFCALLARSSARVTSLSLCISCAPFLIPTVVNHLFESLASSDVVPHSLSITIVFPNRLAPNQQNVFPHIQELLQHMNVSSLAGLETLKLSEKYSPCPITSESHDLIKELSLFECWVRSCTSLKDVTVFGRPVKY